MNYTPRRKVRITGSNLKQERKLSNNETEKKNLKEEKKVTNEETEGETDVECSTARTYAEVI